MRIVYTILLSIFTFFCSLYSQNWQKLNGPWTGYFTAVTSNDSDPAVLFAGGNSGVIRSDDNGVSWIKVSSANGDNIAQGVSIAGYVFSPSGTTKNGGDTWEGITLPDNISNYLVYDTEINPNAAGNVFLLTYEKLYRSTNFGQNWLVSDDSAGYYRAEIIKISKSPSNVIYLVGD